MSQTPFVNAGAFGMEHPFIVLNSATLGLLDDAELHMIVGHELGHIISGHALYRTLSFSSSRSVCATRRS